MSGTSARSIPSSYLGLSNWPDRMREGGTVPKVGKLVIGRHFVGSGRRRRAGREARRPRKEGGGSDGNVASAWTAALPPNLPTNLKCCRREEGGGRNQSDDCGNILSGHPSLSKFKRITLL